MAIKALIFDVFGTCVDWRKSVAREVARTWPAIDAMAFTDAWRREYDPSMAPIRNGTRGYEPLDTLHQEGLDRVAKRFGVAPPDGLVGAWERLDPWADVVPGLEALAREHIIAPCSNGSIALMTRLSKYAGLPWDCVLGAELAQSYKPDPAVYLACCKALRLAPEEVMMVAAHNSDLHAAHALGLATGFVPRPNEWGETQTTDLAADGDWAIVAPDFLTLHQRLMEKNGATTIS